MDGYPPTAVLDNHIVIWIGIEYVTHNLLTGNWTHYASDNQVSGQDSRTFEQVIIRPDNMVLLRSFIQNAFYWFQPENNWCTTMSMDITLVIIQYYWHNRIIYVSTNEGITQQKYSTIYTYSDQQNDCKI